MSSALKEKTRNYALSLGVDDFGFAAVADYNSPQGPKIETLFPKAKSIVVACIKEMSHVESPSPQIAMNGRLDIQEYGRSTNYKISRFLEKECGAKAMSVPLSYPLELTPQNSRSVADVSLRHADGGAGSAQLLTFYELHLLGKSRLGQLDFISFLIGLPVILEQALFISAGGQHDIFYFFKIRCFPLFLIADRV